MFLAVFRQFCILLIILCLGAAGVLIGYPLDTVKVKIQTQDPTKGLQYRGTFHCLSEIIKHEGVGLYFINIFSFSFLFHPFF